MVFKNCLRLVGVEHVEWYPAVGRVEQVQVLGPGQVLVASQEIPLEVGVFADTLLDAEPLTDTRGGKINLIVTVIMTTYYYGKRIVTEINSRKGYGLH